jgi:hypothetical protein
MGPFQVAVMEEQLQPPHNSLLAAAHKRRNMIGAKKTMPVNEPDNLPVAFLKPQGSSDRNTFETRKSFLHRAIVTDAAWSR